MITLSLRKRGPIINWLIRKKIARSILSANVFLLLVVVINISAAFFIDAAAFTSPHLSQPYLEDIPLDILETLPPQILEQLPSRHSINTHATS